uniref:Peptidase S1 domain-containing protein n=1 Tax=Anopheles culicifacies TaxID=139723 RepID=A0A182LYM6_9DIPT
MKCISRYAIALIQFCLLLVIDLSFTQSCGQRKVVNFLIVNGIEAKDGDWPWHVAIFHKNVREFVYKCGGTVLDQNTVLTAAHCVMVSNGIIARERLVVQVGRNRLSVASHHAQEHATIELIVHPGYSANGVRHDIALIKLDTDITYNDYIQPICLWNRSVNQDAIVGSWGTVVGFGVDETDNPSDTLRKARLPVVSDITCIQSNGGRFATLLTPEMFCAGNRDETSPCNGDSGGGIFFNYDDTWFIRGLVSFSKSRQDGQICDTKEYTVFTDVAMYLDWIQQHMRGTGTQNTVIANDSKAKIGLLPMSTCGANPYASNEESFKPVLLGYPWVGLLEYVETGSREKKTICHATLISDLYLITAAHCVNSLPKRYTLSSVRLGEYDTNTKVDCARVDGEMVCSPPVQIIAIESVITHANFNKPRYANDIALIRLRDRADTSGSNVKPICLPVTNELRSQKSSHYILTAWASGSGGILLERSVREFVDSIECQKQYTELSILLEKTARQICIKQQQESQTRSAHCLMTSNGIIARERLVVQVGRNRLRVASSRAQEHEAFQLIVHPDYSVNGIRHDIALIKLATDITYTDYIQPICLWNRGEDQNTIVGSTGTVVGFGIDETDNPSDTLREARLPVVSAITCIESNREVFASQLTSNMFCAGNRDGISACNGDSGGGIFFNYDDTWFIRGLVSFTKPREDVLICDTKEYTVFTDVAKYLDWIQQHMRGTSGRPIVVPHDSNAKIGLLPMTTCGANPYVSREETSKPVLLGYPWVGLLEYVETGSREKKTICQATLISDLYLITAAHCVNSLPKRYTLSSVRLGEYDKNTMTDCARIDGEMVCSPPVQTLRIESVISHANFNKPRYANDIALIRLRDRADTSRSNVKPICLPVTNELRSLKPTHYTLTAWSSGSSGNLLERSQRELIDSIACQKMYTDRSVTLEKTTRQICIKQQQESQTRCKFPSSAAPLQLVHEVTGSKRYVIRKVVNYLIVNGTEAKDGYWPWHAAIFHIKALSFSYACGGTILDQNTVLTAAHCLMTSNGIIALERLVVHVGRSRLHIVSDRTQAREAFQFIIHPEYNINSIRDDIALIKLATDITYTDYIQPVCLWNRGEDQHTIVGISGTVVGFGIDETDNPSDTLREAHLPVVSAITCIESNRDVFASQLTSNMFCAGNRDGISACNGDSGGGIFFNFNDVWYIRGVVSFTKPRQDAHICDTKEYTVFTDVAKYLLWIQQNTRGTGSQQTVVPDDSNPKIGLLPMSTCGANPYAIREETSKPILLGYPWVGLLNIGEFTFCHATLISDRYLISTALCAK